MEPVKVRAVDGGGGQLVAARPPSLRGDALGVHGSYGRAPPTDGGGGTLVEMLRSSRGG
jgi:hypothetical protein